MKPARFSYTAPETLEGVLAALAEYGDEAKVLAGGQSLVPMMNFRLARPEVIVDVGRLSAGGNGRANESLADIVSDGQTLRIGARVTHRRLEFLAAETDDSEAVPAAGPLWTLLSGVARWVGHLPIRVRGTFGGSIAHADPAAEWCILVQTLGAEMVAHSSDGRRVIPAEDFFETVFTTSLSSTELLTEVRLPILGDDWKVGFCEFARRAGDFAVVAALCALRLSDGRIADARVGAGGVAGTPVRLPEAEAVLTGEKPCDELFADAGAAASGEVDPAGDIHGSAGYRRHLTGVMVQRALTAHSIPAPVQAPSPPPA